MVSVAGFSELRLQEHTFPRIASSALVSVAGFSELRLQAGRRTTSAGRKYVSVAGFSELRLQEMNDLEKKLAEKKFQLLVSLN